MSPETIQLLIEKARKAQAEWRLLSVSDRVRRIANIPSLLVERRVEIANAIACPSRQDYRETITSELFPLADTAKWLYRRASKILAPRRQRFPVPKWLGGLRSTVYRDPLGVVLILGTWNYPLFLPGAQILHAIAGGNAVVIKPARDCEKVTSLFVEILVKAGVPQDLVVMLDPSIESARLAMEIGMDLVVLTGSYATGQSVLQELASRVTPAVMELSGCDSVIVLPTADLNRVCDLIRFGLRLNGGATCMAPRRIFVLNESMPEFVQLLSSRLEQHDQIAWRTQVSNETANRLKEYLRDATEQGAEVLSAPLLNDWITVDLDKKQNVETGHIVLSNVVPSMRICSADLFAPLTMVLPVSSIDEAIQSNEKCPYALTTAIFGPSPDALKWAQIVTAGFVSINDLIVPTADPNLPFGGRKASGYGVTRGDEGLLSMTTPKVISQRIGNWLPHANLPHPADETLLDGLLQWSHHRRLSGRIRGMMQTIRAVIKRD